MQRDSNIDGVELVKSHEVHPYHLLGATLILLSQSAATKLSESLSKSVPASAGKGGAA